MNDLGAASALASFEYGRGELYARLAGMTDDEYLWAPVPDCWTVNPGDDGWTASNDPETDPAPFTTIAWRMWHLWDCFESYAERAYGTRSSALPYDHFVGSAVEATALLRRAIDHFGAEFEALGPDVAEPLGPTFGPHAESNRVDLTLHVLRELNSHGAEIALLRDLWFHGAR
jgi:hypothetical protein